MVICCTRGSSTVRARRQGLTLIHFQAQREPFLIQSTPSTTPTNPSTPFTPPKQPLHAPPVPLKALTLSGKVDECEPLPPGRPAPRGRC